jgi:hypothetical protein
MMWRKFWADFVLKNNKEPEEVLRQNYPVTPIEQMQQARQMAATAQEQEQPEMAEQQQ